MREVNEVNEVIEEFVSVNSLHRTTTDDDIFKQVE